MGRAHTKSRRSTAARKTLESVPREIDVLRRLESSTSLTVASAAFKFDQIGYWSELKLEIVEKYGTAYTKAFTKTTGIEEILH